MGGGRIEGGRGRRMKGGREGCRERVDGGRNNGRWFEGGQDGQW